MVSRASMRGTICPQRPMHNGSSPARMNICWNSQAQDIALPDVLSQLVAALISDWNATSAGLDLPANYDPPAACLILAKRYGDGWKALRLGDSCLLARDSDRSHRIFAASPNNAFDHWLSREARKRRDAGVLDIKALLAEFRPQLQAGRAKRNQPGGYSILECSEASLAMPEYIDLGHPAEILLCTDGYYRAVDHYEMCDDAGLLDASAASVDKVLERASCHRGIRPRLPALPSIQACRRCDRGDAGASNRGARPMNFRAIKLAGVLLAAGTIIAPLAAEEAITTMSSEDSKDGMVTRSVHFAGACGDECLLASLHCGGAPRFEAELIDVPAKDAAKSLSREQSLLILAASGKTFEMPVTSFAYTEMNGSWDVSAYGQDPDAVFKALAAAKSFTLSVEARKEKLPVTAEVKAWAKACLK